MVITIALPIVFLLFPETPLNTIHLENLTKLSRMGVQIIPPVPAFYNHPKTLQDIINHNTASF